MKYHDGAGMILQMTIALFIHEKCLPKSNTRIYTTVKRTMMQRRRRVYVQLVLPLAVIFLLPSIWPTKLQLSQPPITFSLFVQCVTSWPARHTVNRILQPPSLQRALFAFVHLPARIPILLPYQAQTHPKQANPSLFSWSRATFCA